MTRDVHAIPWDRPGEHRASPHCPCLPVVMHDLAEPGRVVYVHRSPPDTRPAR